MTSITTESRAQDHRKWLKDIERWRHDLRGWEGHEAPMLSDAQAVVKAVETFLHDVKHHHRSLDRLEHSIADCERSELEAHDSDEPIMRAHRTVGDSLDAASRIHSRLERLRNELTTALSAVRR